MSISRTRIIQPNGDASYHFLLPDHDLYDMSQPAVHVLDFPYIDFVPDGETRSIFIKKAVVTICGPQVWNQGAVVVVLENSNDEEVWWPFIICVSMDRVMLIETSLFRS